MVSLIIMANLRNSRYQSTLTRNVYILATTGMCAVERQEGEVGVEGRGVEGRREVESGGRGRSGVESGGRGRREVEI